MLSNVKSGTVFGIDAYIVDVEVDISKGFPVFSIVGLPDVAIKEARDRVVSAVRNSGFDLPNKKITVNLAPADVKKEGSSFDLAIALGMLASAGKIDKEKLKGYCFLGELALDGTVRSVKGVLPVALSLKENGIKAIVLPKGNIGEASIVRGIDAYEVNTLREAVEFLIGERYQEPVKTSFDAGGDDKYEVDFCEIKGHEFAKRAVEIAAAGGHNLIMIGPPGSGKTMIARRIPTILPDLTYEESIETTKIHSIAGVLRKGGGIVKKRPFRSPHHTSSSVSIIGGGTYPKPGEVSLAHNGVLFFDEFVEFNRDVLEVLRQPLEDRMVSISRAKSSVVFPAGMMLVAAMNPCPCGNYGHPERECLCTPYQIRKYRAKVSEPLLDRVDIQLEIPCLKISDMTDETAGEDSSSIRKRVSAARGLQRERFSGTSIHSNSQMGPKEIKKFCALDKNCKIVIEGAVKKMNMSARAYDRIIKVSRTIADIEGSPEIKSSHIAEAAGYRSFDRVG